MTAETATAFVPWTNRGNCPICERAVTFTAWGTNLRDTYLCGACATLPRERAVMLAIDTFAPGWRSMSIHESSPADRGVSRKLREQCPGYVATQFHPTVPEGSISPDGWRCENLERQTFTDESFDLVVTQDVFEHIFDPDAAAREIARTLRPGGMHIGTTPLVRAGEPTIQCASMVDGRVNHLQAPDYHRNPVDPQGSLVTFWWGYDIASRMDSVAPLNTTIWTVRDKELGLDGPLLEVLISLRL
jgi:SAM-dependent methyltransferase